MENRGNVNMAVSRREAIKNILGQIPFTAELYWLVRQRGRPVRSRFSLKGLQDHLPEINAQALDLRKKAKPGKKVFLFGALHYWIEHAALLGAALSAQGHQVSLGFLPYSDWQTPINLFDLRRQNAYARKVIGQMSGLLEPVSFLNLNKPYFAFPDPVGDFIRQVTIYDAQYTLQDEDVEFESKIYRFRLDRNETFARQALTYLQSEKPDVVIVPNGTIIEHGVIYRLARYLKIPVVTYEFGDQRKRIWIARNAEVMRQETDGLWEARRTIPLTESELDQIRSMFEARQRADLWANFARRWQDAPAQGGERARAELGLDERPVALLATNVLGDSLTLGRQIFSQSMAEWITRTVQYFAGRPDVQLVIRVHPGEVLTHGLSMEKVVHQVLPKLPEHIHLIGAKEKVNTYDLIEVADIGLVYTTTVGMEMALCGLPVIVSGATHYRERGFTKDPDSWVEYFKVLGQILSNPKKFRLTRETVDLAWQYAFRFFFEYPRPFPWHLVKVWDDYKNHPLASVLSKDGLEQYGATFRYLVGEPVDWKNI
jgi:hypothetical protein